MLTLNTSYPYFNGNKAETHHDGAPLSVERVVMKLELASQGQVKNVLIDQVIFASLVFQVLVQLEVELDDGLPLASDVRRRRRVVPHHPSVRTVFEDEARHPHPFEVLVIHFVRPRFVSKVHERESPVHPVMRTMSKELLLLSRSLQTNSGYD